MANGTSTPRVLTSPQTGSKYVIMSLNTERGLAVALREVGNGQLRVRVQATTSESASALASVASKLGWDLKGDHASTTVTWSNLSATVNGAIDAINGSAPETVKAPVLLS